MARLLIGSIVAAVAMFVISFVGYGLLFDLGWASAPEATVLEIQAALKALPHSGTYVIPSGESPAMVAAYAAGPVAQISYNSNGFTMMDPREFAAGFVHMVVTAGLLGATIGAVAGRVTDFASRARLAIGIAVVAVIFIHIAGPIWYKGDWRHAIFVVTVDFLSLTAAGLILVRWFMPVRSTD